MRPLVLSLSLALAACTSAGVAPLPAEVAAPQTAAAPHAVSLAPLDAAPQPILPAPLRGSEAPGLDTAAEVHAAHAPRQAASPAGLPPVLDAYLALHDALASDALDGVAGHAQALDAALVALTATPVDGDPHFWHTRAADLAALRAHAQALAAAPDLAAARVAFGELSVPFARLVEATGLPDGYDLARFTCGMARGVPDGGVWLQRDGATRNPFFGSAMLGCGRRAPGTAPHDAHDHPEAP